MQLVSNHKTEILAEAIWLMLNNSEVLLIQENDCILVVF